MICPFCNIELKLSTEDNEYHCPQDKLYYDFQRNLITVLNDEGNFTFTLNNNNEITCAIFSTTTSGEKVWLTHEDESRRDGCIIHYPDVSQIPKIVNRFEIERIFK